MLLVLAPARGLLVRGLLVRVLPDELVLVPDLLELLVLEAGAGAGAGGVLLPDDVLLLLRLLLCGFLTGDGLACVLLAILPIVSPSIAPAAPPTAVPARDPPVIAAPAAPPIPAPIAFPSC